MGRGKRQRSRSPLPAVPSSAWLEGFGTRMLSAAPGVGRTEVGEDGGGSGGQARGHASTKAAQSCSSPPLSTASLPGGEAEGSRQRQGVEQGSLLVTLPTPVEVGIRGATVRSRVPSLDEQLAGCIRYGRRRIPADQQALLDLKSSRFPFPPGQSSPTPNVPPALLAQWHAYLERVDHRVEVDRGANEPEEARGWEGGGKAHGAEEGKAALSPASSSSSSTSPSTSSFGGKGEGSLRGQDAEPVSIQHLEGAPLRVGGQGALVPSDALPSDQGPRPQSIRVERNRYARRPIPADQRALLDQKRSVFPPLPGQPFPTPNVPAALLAKWHAYLEATNDGAEVDEGREEVEEGGVGVLVVGVRFLRG